MTVSRSAVLAAGVILAAFSVPASAGWTTVNSSTGYGAPLQCGIDQENRWTYAGEVYTSDGAARAALFAAAQAYYSTFAHGYCVMDYNNTLENGTEYRCRSRRSSTNSGPSTWCNPTNGCSGGDGGVGITFTAAVSCVAATAPVATCPSGGTAGTKSGLLIGGGDLCLHESNRECRVTPSVQFTTVGKTAFSYTGDVCTGQSDMEPIAVTENGNPDTSAPEEAVCKYVNGVRVCNAVEETNCGYVNGSRYCAGPFDLTEENPCRQNANGSVFCLESASASERPDDGSGSNPAEETVQTERTNGTETTTVNYYSSGVAANSTNYGDGPGGDQGQSEGGGTCGGEGQDPCETQEKLEEGDMPGAPTFSPWNGDGDGIAGAADDAPSDGWDADALIPDLESGECQSLTLVYFGREMQFPGVKGCAWIEQLKAVLAFCLNIGTIVLITRLVIGSV